MRLAQVIIKMDSSPQKSMPHKRFHGKIGKVKAKRGRGYVLAVPQGNSVKEIIVRSEHIEPYMVSGRNEQKRSKRKPLNTACKLKKF